MAPLLRILGSGALRGRIAANLRKSSGDPTWLTDSVVQVYTRGPSRDLGATINALRGMVKAVEPWPLGPALDQITCPVVLVQGLAPHEGGPDETARAKMRAIPGFALETVPGVGLYAFEEAPNLVVDVIRRVAPAAGKLARSAQHNVMDADERTPSRWLGHITPQRAEW